MRIKAKVLVVGLLLTGVMVFFGCAQPAPTPAPTPAPSPAPTPAPSPAPSPIPLHPKVQIEIWGGNTAWASYALSFAVAEIINRESEWLSAEAKETFGSVVHLTDVATKADKRKVAFFLSAESTNALVREGLSPFKLQYTGARAVAIMYDQSPVWVTYDKNVNTWQDFKGKRLSYMPIVTDTGIGLEVLLSQVYKIRDQVQVSYDYYDSMMRSLRDGTIDVANFSPNGISENWVPGPIIDQLLVEKPGFHFVNLPPEDLQALAKASHMPFHSLLVPAGVFGPWQTQDIYGGGATLGWWCDESVSDDVVYEFVRLLHENIKGLKERVPASFITQENMAAMPLTEDMFHNGAVKFYKEKGTKMGFPVTEVLVAKK